MCYWESVVDTENRREILDQAREEIRAARRAWQGGQGLRGEAEAITTKPVELAPVPLRSAPDKLLSHYGYSAPTEAQKEQFLDVLDQMPDQIKVLWEGKNEVVLAVSPEDLFGRHQSNWIMLDRQSFGGPVARHEFTHHIIAQTRIESNLGKYNPGMLYRHADVAGNFRQQRNEDITMVLDAFDPDPEKWADDMLTTHSALLADGSYLTRIQAREKVRAVKTFLEVIGAW